MARWWTAHRGTACQGYSVHHGHEHTWQVHVSHLRDVLQRHRLLPHELIRVEHQLPKVYLRKQEQSRGSKGPRVIGHLGQLYLQPQSDYGLHSDSITGIPK